MKTKIYIAQILYLTLLVISQSAFGAEKRWTVAVLPTSNTSKLNIGNNLQSGLFEMYKNGYQFTPKPSYLLLSGFSKSDISHAFTSTPTELLSFAYLEDARVSIFLFDRNRPSRFIVVSKNLNSMPRGIEGMVYLKEQFIVAFSEVVKDYMEGNFKPLPGADATFALTESEIEDNKNKDLRSRAIFREMASLESPFALGAHFGMSRFGNSGAAASTVNFGGFGSYNFIPQLAAQVGIDIFTYALVHGDVRYNFPLGQTFVSMGLGLGVSNIIGTVTSNRSGATMTPIPKGTFLAGPLAYFDLPLLGIKIRGEIRFYTGSSSVLVGTYGAVFPF